MDIDYKCMVSVSLLTYNHEDYIKQCLDGIIAQKVNFSYEVIVGDDCSSDGTRQILEEYKDKYPDVFKLVLRKKNLGVTKNLYDVLKRCKGKYIAGLEGDDYWIDENKLQMQVDFLESNPQYIGCAHEVMMIDEFGKEWYFSKHYLEGRHWTFNKEVYTFRDFEKFALPGQGSTYLYRNIFLQPEHDYSIIETASPAVGDMTLLMLTSAKGDWYFMRGVTMTCYRYVTTLGKQNWASWIRTRNRCDVDYAFREKLEDYSNKVLKIPLNLKDQKFDMFHSALEWYRWGKWEDDREILVNLNKKLEPKYYYYGRELALLIKRKILSPTIAYAIKTGEIETNDPILKKGRWHEFKKATKGRTIVAFGGGAGFDEFLDKYGKRFNVPVILDNSVKNQNGEYINYSNYKNLWADKYDFAQVLSPAVVRDWDKDKFVVLITSTLYKDEMAKQLRNMGFTAYFAFGCMERKRLVYRILWKNLKKWGDK